MKNSRVQVTENEHNTLQHHANIFCNPRVADPTNRSTKMNIGKTLYRLAKRNATCSYIVQYAIIKY